MVTLDSEGFAPLRVSRVVRETPDAVSLVLDLPADGGQQFRYEAGQFLTLRVCVDGAHLRRCYSMSSAPADDELRITVKRDSGGVVSNWLNDTACEGLEIHAAPPDGKFVLPGAAGDTVDIVAFAGGSGITPIMSLLRTALADPASRIRLFYANRSPESVIFDATLRDLAAAHPDRLALHHHYDSDAGVVSATAIEEFAGSATGAHYYVCGPAPFMDTVEQTLVAAGVDESLLHLERFTVAAAAAEDEAASAATETVVIELDRKTTTAPYRVGETLLQTARMAGLKAPASCETGSCGTCMAQVVEGSARMLNNDALDDDEVAEGWVLTCQSLPTSRTVRVVYE